MININFLATKQNKKERQRINDYRLFRTSLYVLIASVVLTVVTLAFNLFLNLRISDFEKKIAANKNSVLARENVELNYLIFVNKLTAIGNIYQNRSSKQAAINYFTNKLQDKAEIVGMRYQEKEGGLILELSNDDIFKLQNSMDLINSPEIINEYKNIEKSALRRLDDGSYRLSIKLELKPIE